MESFYHRLQDQVKEYEGRHQHLIRLTPEWFQLLSNLLSHPGVPPNLRPMICCAIAYFVAPEDVIAEDVIGAYGYVDDIFFSAYVASGIMRLTGSEEPVRDSWGGSEDIVPLVRDVLNKRAELLSGSSKVPIDESVNYILDYTGYSELLDMLGQ